MSVLLTRWFGEKSDAREQCRAYSGIADSRTEVDLGQVLKYMEVVVQVVL